MEKGKELRRIVYRYKSPMVNVIIMSGNYVLIKVVDKKSGFLIVRVRNPRLSICRLVLKVSTALPRIAPWQQHHPIPSSFLLVLSWTSHGFKLQDCLNRGTCFDTLSTSGSMAL